MTVLAGTLRYLVAILASYDLSSRFKLIFARDPLLLPYENLLGVIFQWPHLLAVGQNAFFNDVLNQSLFLHIDTLIPKDSVSSSSLVKSQFLRA